MIVNKPNILWITVDACRKDMFYELPFIRELSKNSIVFENAFANAPWTLPSVASMFTGLYPSQHGALNEKTRLKKGVRTIAEILKEKGYDTIIITQNDGWIIPYYGLTRGFKKIYDIEKILQNLFKIRKKETMKAIVKYFIGYHRLTRKMLKDVISKARKPWFLYLHLMDTHMPYEPHTLPFVAIIRRYIFYKNWKEKMQKTWIGEKGFTEKELHILRRLYSKAMKNVSKEIKKYLDMVNKNTILIISADHGENLGEYGMVGHQFSFHDTLINVPLIVSIPFINKGERIETLFETKYIFNLIQDIVEKNKIDDFYPKDYVFGEKMEIESVFEKLKKINPDISIGGRFIRTKKIKYIKYQNGKEKLYLIEGKSEKEFKNDEVLENLRSLMMLKEKKIDVFNVGKKWE